MSCIQELVDNLLKSDPDLIEHHRFHDYFDYCVKSLMNHGEVVSDRLASKRHADLWARLTDTEKEPMGLFSMFSVYCRSTIYLLSRKVLKGYV